MKRVVTEFNFGSTKTKREVTEIKKAVTEFNSVTSTFHKWL